MGGKAFELYSEQFLRERAEARTEGRTEGRIEGRLHSLVELVRDGLLDLKIAAERAGMPVEGFQELLTTTQQAETQKTN